MRRNRCLTQSRVHQLDDPKPVGDKHERIMHTPPDQTRHRGSPHLRSAGPPSIHGKCVLDIGVKASAATRPDALSLAFRDADRTVELDTTNAEAR